MKITIAPGNLFPKVNGHNMDEEEFHRKTGRGSRSVRIFFGFFVFREKHF